MKEIEQVRLTKAMILTAVRAYFKAENSTYCWTDVKADDYCDIDGQFSLDELADKILSYGR